MRRWLPLLVCLTRPGTPAQPLQGVVDIHLHTDPDVVPRSIDAIEVTRLARQRGLRAIVLKNHYEPTVSTAWLAAKAVPGIQVFGGIALNRAVGGVNPAAVERMARVKGALGRMVWMPTLDAENHVKASQETRPFVSITRNGQLLPEVKEVLDLIAKHNLVLATGHSSAAEVMLLVREAKARGVQRIVLTHAMYRPVSLSAAQAKEAGRLGAYTEFCSNEVVGAKPSLTAKQVADMMRAVGPEYCILSSDLGQAGNPLHPDGLEMLFGQLREAGLTAEQIERMTKVNPARLLGLP